VVEHASGSEIVECVDYVLGVIPFDQASLHKTLLGEYLALGQVAVSNGASDPELDAAHAPLL